MGIFGLFMSLGVGALKLHRGFFRSFGWVVHGIWERPIAHCDLGGFVYFWVVLMYLGVVLGFKCGFLSMFLGFCG